MNISMLFNNTFIQGFLKYIQSWGIILRKASFEKKNNAKIGLIMSLPNLAKVHYLSEDTLHQRPYEFNQHYLDIL